ncbi:hypothetical protein H9P43_000864 [Blastocladiella emersonii ATCC 22665]|nr:hypothetical protein H9P43_000864 [Blastocladiella emersonii ATCC 22665]
MVPPRRHSGSRTLASAAASSEEIAGSNSTLIAPTVASSTAAMHRAPSSSQTSARRVTFSVREGRLAHRSSTAETSLSFANEQLTELPEELAGYRHPGSVKSLDLSKNRLESVPLEWAKFSSLRRLNLSHNKLTTVPAAIPACPSLVWLDLSGNPLASLPHSIGRLHQLRGLGLGACTLRALPETLFDFVNLSQLSLYSNKLESLSPAIGALTKLTRLDLSGNRLSILPDEIGALASLEWLNLSANRLRTLPETMTELSRLKELGVGDNALQELPDLSGLRQLVKLIAFKNELVTVDALADLAALEHLDLSRNHLARLPSNIFTLPRLSTLLVQHNQLTSLPSQFTFARPRRAGGGTTARDPPTADRVVCALATLDVSGNPLTSLPWPLAAHHPWTSLRVYSTALSSTTAPLGQRRPSRAPRLLTLAANAVLASQPMYRVPEMLHPDHTPVSARVLAVLARARRCDECWTPFVTDADAAAVLGEEADGEWYGAVALAQVHDHGELPCAYQFCGRACTARWRVPAAVGGGGGRP